MKDKTPFLENVELKDVKGLKELIANHPAVDVLFGEFGEYEIEMLNRIKRCGCDEDTLKKNAAGIEMLNYIYNDIKNVLTK